MSSYKMMITAILFFGLFTGGIQFQQDFYSQQGLETGEQTDRIQAQYDEMDQKVENLRENVETVSKPQDSVLDSATAGLFLVPNFLDLLLSPIEILSATIDAVVYNYAFVPDFLADLLKTLIALVVSYSAFRLLIGLRG